MNCLKDNSFEKLNQEIINLSKDRSNNFPEIGRKLETMKKKEIFQKGGFKSFSKYIGSLDGTPAEMDYSTAFDLVSIYDVFIDLLSHKKERQVLKKIGWSKLSILARYIRSYADTINILNSLDSDSGYHIPSSHILNVTGIIQKGLEKSKADLKDELQEEKQKGHYIKFFSDLIIPTELIIKKHWDTEGFRLLCPKCGKNTVRIFNVREVFNKKEDNSSCEITHEAYFKENGEKKVFEELFSHTETTETESFFKPHEDNIQCFLRGGTGEVVHDFAFWCSNCETRQYMIQIETRQYMIQIGQNDSN